MEKTIQQLVEMGASVAQARAALDQYKNDVMQAAEGIFGGEFDNVCDEDEDVETTSHGLPTAEMAIFEDGDEIGALEDDDEDCADYADYDSDGGFNFEPNRSATQADPYAGISFSKHSREEVIEVEEEPESVKIHASTEPVKVMGQGQWMKGCPQGREQGYLFSLYSQLTEGECVCPNKCGHSVPYSKGLFFAIFPMFSTYIEHLRSIIPQRCPQCDITFCLACGDSISASKATSSFTGTDLLFHCPSLQGVILGVGLSMLEEVYADTNRLPTVDKNNGWSKKRKLGAAAKEQSTSKDDGKGKKHTGAGKKTKGGVGYAGDYQEYANNEYKTELSEALAVQRVRDENICALLADLRNFLPSIYRQGGGQTSDFLVHPTTLAHLRRRFNTVCSSLLRNDSLTDMSDRAALYEELLEWLETISNHEALASMMAMPCMIAVSVRTIAVRVSADSGRATWERALVYEGSSGPRELLEAIVIQAQAALKGLDTIGLTEYESEEMTEEQKRMNDDTKGKAKETASAVTDERERLRSFCQRIVATAKAIDRSLRETKGDAFVEQLHKSLPRIQSSSIFDPPVDPGANEASAREAYVNWATRVRFEYCDLTIPLGKNNIDETLHYKFSFDQQARLLANSDVPKRSLAIAKELAILTTNLPVAWESSIFLRVDESRVDVIKALITGPAGTPYHNGCYLFDIFLGPNYNYAPPCVKYMTTDGGKYRFNPNLYPDGKVCLSLLGTWAGPGWISGKSTLLQVLVSIQSMILCDEPYLNEPAFSSSGTGTPQSQAYSANVRRMVVKIAMLQNLEEPPEPFQDVIRTHFRLKAASIINQLTIWLKQDDGNSTGIEGDTAFWQDVNKLKKLLKELHGSNKPTS